MISSMVYNFCQKKLKMRYNWRNTRKINRVSPVMAQLLFVSHLFLLFHSTVERNRIGRFVTKFQSLLYLAMDSGGGKAGFSCNLSQGFVLGLKLDELLEVVGS